MRICIAHPYHFSCWLSPLIPVKVCIRNLPIYDHQARKGCSVWKSYNRLSPFDLGCLEARTQEQAIKAAGQSHDSQIDIPAQGFGQSVYHLKS